MVGHMVEHQYGALFRDIGLLCRILELFCTDNGVIKPQYKGTCYQSGARLVAAPQIVFFLFPFSPFRHVEVVQGFPMGWLRLVGSLTS